MVTISVYKQRCWPTSVDGNSGNADRSSPSSARRKISIRFSFEYQSLETNFKPLKTAACPIQGGWWTRQGHGSGIFGASFDAHGANRAGTVANLPSGTWRSRVRKDGVYRGKTFTLKRDAVDARRECDSTQAGCALHRRPAVEESASIVITARRRPGCCPGRRDGNRRRRTAKTRSSCPGAIPGP